MTSTCNLDPKIEDQVLGERKISQKEESIFSRIERIRTRSGPGCAPVQARERDRKVEFLPKFNRKKRLQRKKGQINSFKGVTR